MKHTMGQRWYSNTYSSQTVLMQVSKTRRKKSITHTDEVHAQKSCTNITVHCILSHVTTEIRPYYKYGNVVM
jgi:hypothetical protein